MTAKAHLHNVKYIDWVLSSIVTYPALWRESWLSVKGSQPDAVWSECTGHTPRPNSPNEK
jgi:hypothetical protein